MAPSDTGQGYYFLTLGVGASAILLVISDRLYIFKGLRKSQFLLILFVTYLIINLIFDTGDINLIKSYTIETTGIIFGLVFGLLTSFTISDIYAVIKKNRNLTSLTIIFALLYLTIILILSIRLLQELLGDVRSDIFLTISKDGDYQHSGMLIFIQSIFCSVIVVLIRILSFKRIILWIAVSLYFLQVIIFGLLAQLIGSNSGLMTVVGYFLMTLIIIFMGKFIVDEAPKMKSTTKGRGGLFVRFAVGSSFIAVTMMSLLSILVYFDILNTRLFRITGYGADENSSVSSRIDLLKNNFFTHFLLNPVFGNTQVDVLTTGEGTYVHSLLSVLTHLGMIGFSIFGLMIYKIYQDIAKERNAYNELKLSSNPFYNLYTFGSLSIVFLKCQIKKLQVT
jgi:hypothetical protein